MMGLEKNMFGKERKSKEGRLGVDGFSFSFLLLLLFFSFPLALFCWR